MSNTSFITTRNVTRIQKKAIPRTYQSTTEPAWMRRLLIGVALAVPAGATHQMSNAGEGPLTFFVVSAPPVSGDAERV